MVDLKIAFKGIKDNSKALTKEADRNILRNLYRTGGYIRTVSKRIAKKKAYDSTAYKLIFYQVDRDAKRVAVEHRPPRHRAEKRGNKNFRPIRVKRAEEVTARARLNKDNINGLYYWIAIKTAKQKIRSDHFLSLINARKSTQDKKSVQEILNIALSKSTKAMMDIWGRYPLVG